jgi:hypothetical protein
MESKLGFTIDAVRAFSGVPVRVVLADKTEHRGRLRTDLLSDRSLSVYIAGDGDEGATLYIDQIAEIVPLSTISAP